MLLQTGFHMSDFNIIIEQQHVLSAENRTFVPCIKFDKIMSVMAEFRQNML